jgi:hypothetical protein
VVDKIHTAATRGPNRKDHVAHSDSAIDISRTILCYVMSAMTGDYQ